MKQENVMLKYIESQPERLNLMLDQYIYDLDIPCCNDGYDRIILVGSGSSYNAGVIAQPLMEKIYGREVSVFSATALKPDAPLSGDKKLWIAISQEGTSSNTCGFVRSLTEENPSANVVSLTSKIPSPLTRLCRYNVLINCGEENCGPKTLGVCATVVTLWLTAMGLKRKENRCSDEDCSLLTERMRKSLSDMEQNIKSAECFAEKNKELLSKAKCFSITAKKENLGIALESALKIDETLFIQAAAYEFEEFLHGPFAVIRAKGSTVIVLAGPDDEIERTVRMTNYFKNNYPESHAFLVTCGNIEIDSDLTLTCPDSDMAIFSMLLPGQTISAIVSDHMNQPAHDHGFGPFMDLMGSKLK